MKDTSDRRRTEEGNKWLVMKWNKKELTKVIVNDGEIRVVKLWPKIERKKEKTNKSAQKTIDGNDTKSGIEKYQS